MTDIDGLATSKATRRAKVLYEKKNTGDARFVAAFEDSEGNRVAFSQVMS